MATNAVLISLCSFAVLILAYFTYGRFLARRIFRLDPNRPTPAHTKQDGVDYVPTKIPVLFGHHFASIAGLGPILGPAIAVIWGWGPAVLWVVCGCIFMGAVHDLGALTVSLRYQGRSIGDVCSDLIGHRARFLFLLIIFFLMSLAMGAFVNAISALFVKFHPGAIIPSFGLMLVAMCIGIAVYRLRVGLGPATVVGLIAFGGLIYWGVQQPLPTYEWFASDATQQLLTESRNAGADVDHGSIAAAQVLQDSGHESAAADLTAAATTASRTWIYVLLGYGFIASVLPVWLLLQPRDYINSFQLYLALALLVAGLTVAAATGSDFNVIDAAMIRDDPQMGAPPMVPFLFVTIACGAVSGFHSLVSSGTTVRQLDRETDALPIGFGAMLTEGALAILVIMACVAGLGSQAWEAGGAYASWGGIGKGGLGVQLDAVIHGGANFLSEVGVSERFGQAFLAVTIVAFAMTTLDSATRLLRFNVEEIFRSIKLEPLANRYFASLVAVGGIALFAQPQGAALWVLFGTTNQLLAGLTLLTVSLFLFKLRRPIIYTLIPMGMMLVMTAWAMAIQLKGFYKDKQWLLFGVSVVVVLMTTWLVIEAILSFCRGRGGLSIAHDDEDPHDDQSEVVSATHLG